MPLTLLNSNVSKKRGKLIPFIGLVLLEIGLSVSCVDGVQRPFTPEESQKVPSKGPMSFAIVQPILNRACTPCHSNRASYEEASRLAADPGARGLLQRVVIRKDMPPPSQPQAHLISDEDRELIGHWINCGAPQEERVCDSGQNDSTTVITQPSTNFFTCAACHGFNERLAVTPSSVTRPIPNLAGQRFTYLQLQVMAFKTGERFESTMGNIVRDIPAEKLAELVAFYSSLQPTRNSGRPISSAPATFDEKLYQKGAVAAASCLGCHYNASTQDSLSPSFPRLAGQQKDYLIRQLKAFRQEGDKPAERINPTMNAMAAGIASEEDLEAIAYFFSVLPYEPEKK